MIASDIHGSAYGCRRMLRAFENEKADRLILLGDILYHGPRNDLPEQYAPKEVIAMLNEVGKQLLCVRGNCDAEVDQMVLSFPIMAEYCLIEQRGKLVFATHGYHYNPSNPPHLNEGDILLTGHTHIPVCEESKHFLYMNPGSVSIPKESSPYSYMTMENGIFTWKDLIGKPYSHFEMK